MNSTPKESSKESDSDEICSDEIGTDFFLHPQ